MKSANRAEAVVIVALVVVLGLILAVGKAGAAQGIHVVRLHANSHAKTWRSPQRYGLDTEIRADVRVHGHELAQSISLNGCTDTFRGHGATVAISVCGRGPVPIRVRYSAYGSIPVSLVYRAVRL